MLSALDPLRYSVSGELGTHPSFLHLKEAADLLGVVGLPPLFWLE